jgi:site-specific recombinase XerD
MKNITIRYYLIPSNTNLEKRTKPEAVYAEVSGSFITNLNGKISYSKFKFSLETKILPKYFGSIKEKKGVENYKYDIDVINKNATQNKALRNKTHNFKNCIDDTMSYFDRNNINPSKVEFKNYLTKLVRGNSSVVIDFTFLYILEKQIKYLESIIDSVNNDEVKNNTINAYRNLKPHLNNWANTNGELKFSQLTEKKYNEFWDFVKQKKGSKKSTIKTYQTYFLKTCKVAKKDGIIFDLNPYDKNLIVDISNDQPSEKTIAYLNESDLKKIIDFEVVVPKTCRSEKTLLNLQRAKDFILLSSFTGMRMQSMIECNDRDIKQFKDNEYNFWYIRTIQEKTSTECETPIFPPAFEIIKANNYKFPDFSTNWLTLANANKNIRKILEMAGIKNHTLFSSKNCRNTYVTNLAELGIDEPTIAIVTHPDKLATNKSTHVYNRMKPLDRAKKFVKAINQIDNKKTLYRLS